MSERRGSLPADLRGAARTPIEKRRLADLLQRAPGAPAGARLWLAEPWPWTPGTEGAIATRRPRWAVFAVDLAVVERLAAMPADESVREMNKEHDPWPTQSRQLLPSPVRTPPAEPGEPGEPIRCG